MKPIVILILLVIFLSSCGEKLDKNRYVLAEVLEENYIECFSPKTYYLDKTLASCELSGVAYVHDSIFLVNDKAIPATTPFMGCRFKIPFSSKSLERLGSLNVVNARKLEDIAVTPQQKYMFLTTAFNRYEVENPYYDSYNIILYKEVGSNTDEKIIDVSYRDNVASSIKLRAKIQKALSSRLFPYGPEYFKISAIAAVPGNRLLIGVREIGHSYKNYNYTFTIVGAEYTIEDGEFYFTEELKVMYYFNPKHYEEIEEEVGLTSMDYDIHNDRLYFTTAYETSKTDEGVGGYLWIVSMTDFYKNKPPKLAVDKYNAPIHFAHKPGGIAVLDENRTFIVHDDDRITGSPSIFDERKQFTRKLNQGAYSIVYTY